jgi:hypothetical protein
MFDAGLELDVGEVRANVFDQFRDVARIMEDQNLTFWVAKHDWHPVTLSFVGLNEKRHALAFGVEAETTPSSDTQEKVLMTSGSVLAPDLYWVTFGKSF